MTCAGCAFLSDQSLAQQHSGLRWLSSQPARRSCKRYVHVHCAPGHEHAPDVALQLLAVVPAAAGPCAYFPYMSPLRFGKHLPAKAATLPYLGLQACVCQDVHDLPPAHLCKTHHSMPVVAGHHQTHTHMQQQELGCQGRLLLLPVPWHRRHLDALSQLFYLRQLAREEHGFAGQHAEEMVR